MARRKGARERATRSEIGKMSQLWRAPRLQLHEMESPWSIKAKQTYDLTCTLGVSLWMLWKGDMEEQA